MMYDSGEKGEEVVGCRFTFWRSEMNDVAVFFEHVDLFDGLDGLHIQLLQRGL